MARICQVTGRRVGFGNRVSHSHRRTRRRFDANLQERRFLVGGRYVRLTVSAKGLKVIDRDGIESVVARLRAKGVKV